MWTEEARQRERDRINQTQPWKESTGPKTAAGKQQSSKNSLKHGMRSAKMRKLEKQLAELNRLEREARKRVDEF